MNKRNKNIILIIVVALIVVSIWYLEAKKPAPITSGAADIIVTDSTIESAIETETATSTVVAAASSIKVSADRATIRAEKLAKYSRAKELVDPTGFINVDPSFKLSDVVGKKVVLVDFWTYSCINCQRTTPYLNAWYDKYKDDGLVIVGIHTPEFSFEKDYDNVSKAVKEMGIQYPVVMDSNNGTWNAYQNRYWPREYLIDIDGFIVHDKIGEGNYAGTEKEIQEALEERQKVLGLHQTIDKSISAPKTAIMMDETKVQSPETYFGSGRNEYLGNGQRGVSGSQTLHLPGEFNLNTLYLDGTWNIEGQFAENTGKSAKIIFKYNAKNVYLVGSGKAGVKAKILIDGSPISATVAGKDVAADGTVSFKDNRLYDLVKGVNYGIHTLELDIEGAGLDAFTFTFG